MARTHERSLSPDSMSIKRLKISHAPLEGDIGAPASSNSSNKAEPGDHTSQFTPGIFDYHHIATLHSGYLNNSPFKYAVVEKLFQDELLKKVKDECLSELNFTEKETDIYKVNQTGDLASLNYLTSTQISLLPNLLTLRDALYSFTFRSFLQAVTGCGPLSGKKQDMSVNSYTKSCHLLSHDDVIGTRRVSYILYMPLPHYQLWQKDWGGALELYPVKMGEQGQLEPEPIPEKSIPPSWNQFIFFEVQPGRSFHSVEEVVVGGEGEDGRERLSISGWFHAAQEGEEGYIPTSLGSEIKSSREQLTSTSTVFKPYPESTALQSPDELQSLSEDYVAFLSEFLNPVYLQPRIMKGLASRFVEESSLELHSFLSNDLAESLEPRLRELDTKDGLGADRVGRVPPHSAGIDGAWSIRGPPHKWRYCALKPLKEGAPAAAVSPRAAYTSSDEMMRSLQDELFSSVAFRAWLVIVSRLVPLRYAAQARRFRPGLDYTLATSEEKDVRLDVVLGLTPAVGEEIAVRGKASQLPMGGWHATEWGGWECYMAPHNEEDDPAIYRSSTHVKSKKSASDSDNRTKDNMGSPSLIPAGVDEEEDEEDSTLLAVQPGFNRLLLVLRDERVMRFVKYVSAAAEGSRWDVCAEYEVGMIEEDDDAT